MILGSENLGRALQIATTVVPVAVYFLVLGLLNSRRHPQMLSGRLDFSLMIAALSPLFLVPAVQYVGASLLTITGLVVALTAGVLVSAFPFLWMLTTAFKTHAEATSTHSSSSTSDAKFFHFILKGLGTLGNQVLDQLRCRCSLFLCS